MTRRALWAAVVLVGCRGPEPVADPVPAVQVDRTPLVAEPFLPSLSPHRLAVTDDVALVSDPEGPNADGRSPAVHVVGIRGSAAVHTLVLPDGANPGAVEINRQTGLGYVISRGGGGVYAVDLHERRLGAFTPACRAPVDLAAKGLGVVVACRGGELVTIEHESVVATQQTGRHLTAIAVDSAGAIVVGTAEGDLLRLGRPTQRPAPRTLDDRPQVVEVDQVRRLVAAPDTKVVGLFLQHLTGELAGPPGPGPIVPDAPTGAYGSGGATGPGACTVAAAGGAVAVSRPGNVRGAQATATALAADVAVSADGRLTVVADAAGDALDLLSDVLIDQNGGLGCVIAAAIPQVTQVGGALSVIRRAQLPAKAPLAVAFSPANRLVVLEGTPVLQVRVLTAEFMTTSQTIAIRARPLPPGFVLFHQTPAPSAGITCAGCHPDGLANGAVTTLQGQLRRVMPLAGRQAMGAAVHWDHRPFSEAVAVGTWEKRMGGSPLSPADDLALQGYVAQLQLPHRPTLDAEALAAGRGAFAKAECGTCHPASAGFTTGGAADVGHGLHKIPSLQGLAYSGPFMSDGCAATLRDRFYDLACGGGDRHGRPSKLSVVEVEALIAYLGSL